MDAEESQMEEQEQQVPKGQAFMDNLLWLFLVSLLISLVVYNAWGLLEIMGTAPAP